MKKEEGNNENLRLYNLLRQVPEPAKKPINAGRLKGFTDINPMWRIKAITEQFGPVGFGWKYEIVSQWKEQVGNEIKVFCNVNLFVKINGEWSEAITGTGGSALATIEKSGLYVSDECYKMALTDALGVAMKALGVAADVYFSKDSESKYYAYTQETLNEQDGIAKLKAVKTQEEFTKVWNEYACFTHDTKSEFYKVGCEVIQKLSKQ